MSDTRSVRDLPNTPSTGGGSTTHRPGISEADLAALNRSMGGDHSDGAGSMNSSRPATHRDDFDKRSAKGTAKDDDRMSLASSVYPFRNVDDSEFDFADDTTTTTATTTTSSTVGSIRPASNSDILATWPEDRLQALSQHVKVAPWHNVRYRLQTFQQGMTGQEIQEWLIESKFAKDKGEAYAIGTSMVARGMFFQLNRRAKFNGFAPSATQQYTLVDQLDGEGSSIASTLSRVVKAKEKVEVPPFRLVQGEHRTSVFIEERQRRVNALSGFAHSALKEADGPMFSMNKDDVPIPAVNESAHEECEWATNWEPVVTGQTDEEGWTYALDFKETSRFVQADANSRKNFDVRKREWVRQAHVRAIIVEEPLPGEVEKTDAEIEEERKQEILHKAAQYVSRVPRRGTLKLTISSGEALFRVCDSFVVVEYSSSVANTAPFKEKSPIAPRQRAHRWNYSVEVPLASDLEGVRLTVFQEPKIGRPKSLGQALLCIEAGALSREEVLALAPREEDTELMGHEEYLGTVHVNWTFVVDGEQTDANGGHISQQLRCLLTLVMKEGAGFTVQKRRAGPCGVPIPGGRKEKLNFFFRVKYMGDHCDMHAYSPFIKFSAVPQIGWTFCGLVDAMQPVLLEYWLTDQATPAGIIDLRFDPTVGTVEMPHELVITKAASEGLPGNSSSSSSSAAGNLGVIQATVQWRPIKASGSVDVPEEESLIRPAVLPPKNLLLHW